MTYKPTTQPIMGRVYHIESGVIFDINMIDDGNENDVKITEDTKSKLPQFTVTTTISGESNEDTYFLDFLIKDGDKYSDGSGFTPSKHDGGKYDTYFDIINEDAFNSVSAVLLKYGLPKQADLKTFKTRRLETVVPKYMLTSNIEYTVDENIKRIDDSYENLQVIYKQAVISAAQSAAMQKLSNYSFSGEPAEVTSSTTKVSITDIAAIA